jgi:hypothetical protein
VVGVGGEPERVGGVGAEAVDPVAGATSLEPGAGLVSALEAEGGGIGSIGGVDRLGDGAQARHGDDRYLTLLTCLFKNSRDEAAKQFERSLAFEVLGRALPHRTRKESR